MNDERKTKKQLLEELERERERADVERERSLALQEVSKRVAAANDTDAVLDLNVNEPSRPGGAAEASGVWVGRRAQQISEPAYTGEAVCRSIVLHRLSP